MGYSCGARDPHCHAFMKLMAPTLPNAGFTTNRPCQGHGRNSTSCSNTPPNRPRGQTTPVGLVLKAAYLNDLHRTWVAQPLFSLKPPPQPWYPPPPCPSTPQVRKTTVTRARVLRQARAPTRCAVPYRLSPKTCPYLTLSTIVATGHCNTMCRQLSACSGGPHSPFWGSPLPVRGISSCGIEALSNVAPHLEQLHTIGGARGECLPGARPGRALRAPGGLTFPPGQAPMI